MEVRDVLLKYHSLVPFPWSIRKIKKAGHNPTAFFLDLGREIAGCEDIDKKTGKTLLKTLRELEMGI